MGRFSRALGTLLVVAGIGVWIENRQPPVNVAVGATFVT